MKDAPVPTNSFVVMATTLLRRCYRYFVLVLAINNYYWNFGGWPSEEMLALRRPSCELAARHGICNTMPPYVCFGYIERL